MKSATPDFKHVHQKHIKRERLKDRLASQTITVGGIAVIVSVIAIIVLIVKVTLPLFKPANADLAMHLPLPLTKGNKTYTVGIDDYGETGYWVDGNGTFCFFHLPDGKIIQTFRISEFENTRVTAIETYKNSILNLFLENNSIIVVQVNFKPEFDNQGQRTIQPEPAILAKVQLPATLHPKQVITRGTPDDRFAIVALMPDNSFHIILQTTTTDLFDNTETTREEFVINEKLPGHITTFTMNETGENLYAGTDNGYLLKWAFDEDEGFHLTDITAVTENQQKITALQLVFGDISIAVGDSKGNISTWMPVRTEGDPNIKKLRRIHTLQAHDTAVERIMPSRRNKGLWSMSVQGTIHADHMTSENHLLTLKNQVSLFGISNRGYHLISLGKNNEVLVWEVDMPHPETNFKTLFAPVWYEGYDNPAFVWQSSAQSDDAEPKLSITPLIFGTLKGTLYAMIFAVPLAIFGAVYTSQFTTPVIRQAVKPIIEILASVPSVVIGFLIALWLAPIVEHSIFPVLLSLPLLPLVFLCCMLLIQPLYKNERFKNRIKGYEFLLLLPAVLLTAFLALKLGPPLEKAWFAGDIKLWLFNELGMRYDQRNCIIIAFGLGVCVIPIIFSITEDALSNIPASLTAASLALGASRWQTVWRVILPSASPGIFAAIIIGFGRAVGETMVVLMATGNTPIMDWSIFNGMRTLSANIAVEIPEAPIGGTLYRTLFLCATILFCLTFIMNTGAEIVRERLRKKYGRY